MRRWVVWIVVVALSGAANSQPGPKTARVAYLHAGNETTGKPYLEAFREGLLALGYKEQQNVVLDVEYADGRFERLPAIVQSLLDRKPDVILAATTPGV